MQFSCMQQIRCCSSQLCSESSHFNDKDNIDQMDPVHSTDDDQSGMSSEAQSDDMDGLKDVMGVHDQFTFRTKDEVARHDAEDELPSEPNGAESEGDGIHSEIERFIFQLWISLLEVLDQRDTKSKYAGGVDEDVRISLEKEFEDALRPRLERLLSAVRSQWEHQRKLRDRFLALEEKRLVLRRERLMLFKRRSLGRLHRSLRTSSAKCSRLRIRQPQPRPKSPPK